MEKIDQTKILNKGIAKNSKKGKRTEYDKEAEEVVLHEYHGGAKSKVIKRVPKEKFDGNVDDLPKFDGTLGSIPMP